KLRFIVARAAVSTLIWSCFDGRPLPAAGAAGAVVLVPAMTPPVTGARRGCPAGPATPAWADGSQDAALRPAAVIGNVRLNSALRMYLLLRASRGRAQAKPGRVARRGQGIAERSRIPRARRYPVPSTARTAASVAARLRSSENGPPG